MPARSLCLFTVAVVLAAPAAEAVLTFNVNFTPQAQSDLSAADQALVNDAIQFWDNIIDGYRDGSSRTWNLTVNTFSQPSSGGGVTLGSAQITALAFSGVVPGSHTGNGRFIISTAAQADFNVHPDAGPLDPYTLRHEIGHALGIGTLWQDNELYNSGGAIASNRVRAGGVPGQLVGPATLDAYRGEFDPTASFVPVELDGGPGSAHIHWNEVLDHWSDENVPGSAGDPDPGDSSPAPRTPNGFSLDDEMMTGVKSGPGVITTTTRASLYDIGFTLHAPIPEPGTLTLLALGGLLLARRRRS